MSLNKLLTIFGVGVMLAMPVKATVSLFDSGLNLDGTIFMGDLTGAPPSVDGSGFDFWTGFGDITVDVTGAGSHYVALFLDHEIDENVNTYFNENGTVNGTAAAGQSFEIDEPGFAFGDIFDNFSAGTLDNANAVPAGWEDDVSMALDWNFTLGADQMASITFGVAANDPGGFSLLHRDGASPDTIYFSSVLDVSTIVTVPEPDTVVLLVIGLLALAVVRHRRTVY